MQNLNKNTKFRDGNSFLTNDIPNISNLGYLKYCFRIGQEYEHNPAQPFVAKIKNYVLEMFCDYNKYCFIKHLICKRLDDIVYLETQLKAEYKTEEVNKQVDIPEFMKERV